MQNADVFERGAPADLWRNTMSQIPSVYGRLVYLSSLRNHNNGRYEHHGLALIYGEDEANKTLKRTHLKEFNEWLSFDLEQQQADLGLYISALPESKLTVVRTWLDLQHYRDLLPHPVKGVQRKLYLTDFKVLLELLRNVYAADAPDPGA